MNVITKAMANLARNFLAYVDEKHNVEIDTQRPDIQAPEYMIKRLDPWLDLNIQDLPGEQWKKIKVETRDAMISNMGRLKVTSGRRAVSTEYEIVRPIISTKSILFKLAKIGERDDDAKVRTMSISAAREVLLAFGEKPVWAKNFPMVIERSTSSAFVYKNGDHRDCRLTNLEWVSETRAVALGRSFTKAAKQKRSLSSGVAKDALKKTAAKPVVFSAPSVIPPAPVSKEAREQWYDVSGYVGLYQITQGGSVRSLPRYAYNHGYERAMKKGVPMYLTEQEAKSGSTQSYHLLRGVTLKPLRLKGEKMIQLCRDGSTNPISVARLMIETFYPHVSESQQYEYIDGDLDNCTLSNLRLV